MIESGWIIPLPPGVRNVYVDSWSLLTIELCFYPHDDIVDIHNVVLYYLSYPFWDKRDGCWNWVFYLEHVQYLEATPCSMLIGGDMLITKKIVNPKIVIAII